MYVYIIHGHIHTYTCVIHVYTYVYTTYVDIHHAYKSYTGIRLVSGNGSRLAPEGTVGSTSPSPTYARTHSSPATRRRDLPLGTAAANPGRMYMHIHRIRIYIHTANAYPKVSQIYAHILSIIQCILVYFIYVGIYIIYTCICI